MAVVLTAGLLAVGCSDDGDTIIMGGSGDLNNNDSIPANSIADNNLAADGGGLSPNNTDFNSVNITYCCDCCHSDGTSGADNTAMVLFTVTDGNFTRLFGSYMNGQGLSTPTELRAEDRDYEQGVTLNSYVSICLATAGFTTTDTTAQADAVANNGKWLIVGNYTTYTNDPRNATTQATAGVLGPHVAIAYWIFDPALAGSGITSSTQIGAVGTTAGTARTFENGFLQTGIQLETARGGGTATNALGNLGGNSTVDNNYVNAPNCDVTSYGLVSDGFCGQTAFGGSALPMSNQIPSRANGNAGGNVTTAGAKAYAVAYPNTTNSGLRSAQYEMGERVSYVGLFYSQVVSSTADATANLTESYTGGSTAGQDANHGGAQLQMKFKGFNLATLQFGTETRIDPAAARETRGTGNTTGTLSGVGFYPDFFGYNNFVFMKYCDASLRRGTGSNTGVDPDSAFHALGITVANDAGSHDWNYEQTGGHQGANMTTKAMYEDVCTVLRIADGGAAEAAIAATGPTGAQTTLPFDLTQWNSAAGIHDTTNPTRTGTTVRNNQFHIAPNREMQNYNQNGSMEGKGWRFIFGDDEGLGDVTVFYTSADNTRQTEVAAATDAAGGKTNNIQRQLMAASFNLDGTLVTASDTFNPRVVSTHKNDFVENAVGAGTPGPSITAESGVGNTTVDTAGQLKDGLESLPAGNNAAVWFDACINRTGDYVAIGYLQDEGTSVSFRQALKAVAYQTWRTSYVVTTQATISQTNLNARFAGPVDLSTRTDALANIQLGGAALTADTQDDLGVRNTNRVWSALPVNDFMWQGKVGYRCGIQSNESVLSVLYEQSDTTEDQVYVRALNIVADFLTAGGAAGGTPTIESAATNVQGAPLVASDIVQGHSNYVRRTISTGYANDSGVAVGRNTFKFLNGDVNLGTSVQACDLGVSRDAAGTATGGGLLIVWRQVTDATNSDNDRGDTDLFAARFGDTADAVTDVINIGIDVNEDAPVAAAPANPTLIGGGFDSDISTGGGAVGNEGNGASANTNTTSATGGYDTGATIKLVCVPSNTDISGNRSYSANSVYVYFRGPTQRNVSGSKGLFTRKFDATIRANNSLATQTPAFGDRFIPTVGAGAGTGGTFLAPTRLDHEKGGNVAAQIECCQRGSAVGLFFEQDGHVWFQSTADGRTYLASAGAANPSLVDNDTSSEVTTWGLECCGDSNGDFVSGIFHFGKDDTNAGVGDRLRIRIAIGVN